jgi:hypothetical protein
MRGELKKAEAQTWSRNLPRIYIHGSFMILLIVMISGIFYGLALFRFYYSQGMLPYVNRSEACRPGASIGRQRVSL